MNISKYHPATAWSFTYEVGSDGKRPEWGLVLKNVRHDGHNFAKEIRLVGLRMEVDEIDANDAVRGHLSEFYALNDGDFEVGEVVALTPAPVAHPKPRKGTFQYLKESDEALYLKSYFKVGENHVAYGLRCDYRLKESEFDYWANAEFSALEISQIFLFSRYASSPPHEPSGVLSAARCHPLVKFEFTPSTKADSKKLRRRVRSIRFDYRLHLFLDRHHDLIENAKHFQIGNQAGLFRDNDILLPFGITHGKAGPIFAAVEKPLVLEVVAPALAMGGSLYLDENGHRFDCWDNVHWWGARGKHQPMISSPGAFHAAHIHWRWGTVGERALRPFNRIPTIDTVGTPQSVMDATNIQGALVDPRIWMQTIRVAVAKYERGRDPAIESVALGDLCREDWKTLFTYRSALPDVLDQGEDIVFWYSVEANSELFYPSQVVDIEPSAPGLLPKDRRVFIKSRSYKWAGGGTVFLHGIFFAHNAEQDVLGAGSRWSQYWPNSRDTILKKKSWFRSA